MDYPWPASRISPDEMSLLYRIRQRTVPRVPISRLVALAVQEMFTRPPSEISAAIQTIKPGACYAPQPEEEAS